MGSIVFGMFVALVIADIMGGAMWEAITWRMWREYVAFKRRYSYSDPTPFYEWRDSLNRRKGRSAWAA